MKLWTNKGLLILAISQTYQKCKTNKELMHVRVYNSFNHFSVINMSYDYIKCTVVVNT